MAQNVVDFSGNPSGSGLMDDYLDKDQQNVLSSNSGIQRPSYAVAGTKWLDTSVTPWLWKMYDGTSDITLGTVNPSTHLFTPAGVLPSQDGQSGKFLQTNGTNTVWSDAVDYTNITNCITAIPQDIKLELNDGTLTLKAGSKVYVPNGAGKFDVVTIQNNISVTSLGDTSGESFIYLNTANNNITASLIIGACSGATEESSKNYWYDTTNNIIKANTSSGFTGKYSFPLAIITRNNNAISSIDQIFNGFGYIGSTVFALPGVEGLIPNGRNTDGSLNNSKFKTTSVFTFSPTTGTYDVLLTLTSNRFYWNNLVKYDAENNYNINDVGIVSHLILGYANVVSGRITSFNPKPVFHATDYYDFKQLDDSAAKLDKNNTFTGRNTFIGNNRELLTIKNQNMDLVNGVSLEHTSRLRALDKNDKPVGDLYVAQNTSFSFTQIVAYNSSGQYCNIVAKIAEDGTRSAYTITPPTSDNSTQIATTQFVNNFITKLSSTVGSGYVYIGNLLIQWGSASSGTITFPKPFADTSYRVTLGLTVRLDSYTPTISEKTTTSFNYYAIENRSSDWIAIGQRG